LLDFAKAEESITITCDEDEETAWNCYQLYKRVKVIHPVARRRLAARGRTTEKSRAVIIAARGRSFHPRASGGRVQRDPRNGLPQTQQKARELRKQLPSKVSQLPRRARSQQFPQNQAQVERTHVDQLPFQNVFLAAQMAAPHSARLVAVREAALDQLAAPPQ
jgi:hypothetical protein